MTFTMGSLFSGSGGFELAGTMCGIKPIWASEIEPFCIRVTEKNFPGLIHLGDISKLDGTEIPPVDIITGGSPCQNLSVAGLRTGLAGKQSGLFYEQIRVVKEMRERDRSTGRAGSDVRCRWMVWENVPGAFSSNKGADFQTVLTEIIHIAEPEAPVVPVPAKGWPNAGCLMADDENWSVAYRVLDAQYWGVPQRRRRIFLVADFAGDSAGKILFEREGLSGNFEEIRKARQRAAVGLEEGTGAAGGGACGGRGFARGAVVLNDQGGAQIDISEEVTATLWAQEHGHQPCVLDEPYVPEELKAAGICTEHSAKVRNNGYEEEMSPTLRTDIVPAVLFENHSQDARYTGPLDTAPTVVSYYGTGGNNQPLVMQSEPNKVYAIQGSMIGREEKNGPQGDGINEEVCFTLNTADRHAVACASAHIYSTSKGDYHIRASTDVAGTLVATDYKDPPILYSEPVVRRLTPLECGRLQGFPDYWAEGLAINHPTEEQIETWSERWKTAGRTKSRNQVVRWLNNPVSDSALYRMWGNGVALPCVLFVMEGIAEYADGK